VLRRFERNHFDWVYAVGICSKLSLGRHLAVFFGIGVFCILGTNAATPPLERSVSTSRQFIVYGTTTPLRGAVADLAEETKAAALNVLQQRDAWKIPILLNLQFPQANVPELVGNSLRFSQTGSGLKIQLDLTITRDFDVLAIRRELLRAVLLEMIYRDNQDVPAGSFYVEPPDWLIEGMLAADPLQNVSGLIGAVSALANDDRVLPLEQFLQQKFGLLDSAGQRLYRGYSLAFLSLLMNEPNGAYRLTNYVKTLSKASSDPIADLQSQFPVLSRGTELQALWKTTLSSLAFRHYQLFSIAQTETQLNQLIGRGNDKRETSGVDLNRFVRKKLSAEEITQLRALKEKLMLLGIQANPILRPLVGGYEQVVDRLLAHKIKDVPARLTALAGKREQLRTRTSDIDDYMNWFEATKSGATSGAFTGYLRAAASSSEPPARRRDPLSVYLDALEAQF